MFSNIFPPQFEKSFMESGFSSNNSNYKNRIIFVSVIFCFLCLQYIYTAY